jgi:small multidrug resistance pump
VLIGMLLYQQTPSAGQLMGMALITAGVVLVNLSPATSNG